MSVTIHISVEEMAKHEAQLRAEMISELRPWMKHYMACKGYGGLFQREGEIVTDCTCGLSEKLELLSQVKTPDLEPERDMHWKKRAYDTLAQFGVPFERAKSISNGIRVLATRYEKEIASLRASLEGKHCLCTFDKDGTHLNDCPLHGSIDRSVRDAMERLAKSYCDEAVRYRAAMIEPQIYLEEAASDIRAQIALAARPVEAKAEAVEPMPVDFFDDLNRLLMDAEQFAALQERAIDLRHSLHRWTRPAPAANTEGLRAERSEADIEKLKMDAEHLQYERDEAREKLAAVESEWNKWVILNKEWIEERAVLLSANGRLVAALERIANASGDTVDCKIADAALAEARKEKV